MADRDRRDARPTEGHPCGWRSLAKIIILNKIIAERSQMTQKIPRKVPRKRRPFGDRPFLSALEIARIYLALWCAVRHPTYRVFA
ncbi:MAG: hypothetical protein F6J93_00855 [Oscillatoria sp. SIO1A7]|nr:hypothetical protein [Oscillatoria sp. SIO1A7]